MELDAKGRAKIRATKPLSLTMKVLRPLANLIAENTAPPQVDSILRDFGFSETSTTPFEACGALLRTFEILREEKADADIIKIIEAFLTLYAQLLPNEKLREQGFVSFAREILFRGHFHLGYHMVRKLYVIIPFDGPVHEIAMLREGTTEEDFKDIEKRKMRVVFATSSNKIRVNIDDEKGIYRLIDNQPVRYPHATCKSKIFMTIRYLMIHESATLSELSKHNGQGQKSVKRGIKDFNQASQSRLSLSVDPIIGDGIYKLNQSYIDFI